MSVIEGITVKRSQNKSFFLEFSANSRRIESYSSPQNPKRTQSCSFSPSSGIRPLSSLPFINRSNVPSSVLTISRTLFVAFLESFVVRLT